MPEADPQGAAALAYMDRLRSTDQIEIMGTTPKQRVYYSFLHQ
jgi:hypothetical protein